LVEVIYPSKISFWKRSE